MTRPTKPLLKDAWPELAAELETDLRASHERDLAVQVDALRVHAVCECQEEWCRSFYTVEPTEETYPKGQHRNLALEHGAVLDVVAGEIVFVELFREEPGPRLDVFGVSSAALTPSTPVTST